jgi:hypothetical protein
MVKGPVIAESRVVVRVVDQRRFQKSVAARWPAAFWASLVISFVWILLVVSALLLRLLAGGAGF